MLVCVEEREEKRKRKNLCVCTLFIIYTKMVKEVVMNLRVLRGMENRRIWKEKNEGWKLHNESTCVKFSKLFIEY